MTHEPLEENLMALANPLDSRDPEVIIVGDRPA
jgi:hypothetical protein